jgi:hypothetical protein
VRTMLGTTEGGNRVDSKAVPTNSQQQEQSTDHIHTIPSVHVLWVCYQLQFHPPVSVALSTKFFFTASSRDFASLACSSDRK